MKKTLIKHLSLVVLICMLLSVATSCFVQPGDGTTSTEPTTSTTTPEDDNPDPGEDEGGTWQPPEDEYDIEVPEGYKKLTLYWNKGTAKVSYSQCDMWIFYDDVAGRGYTFTECAYGAKVVIAVPEDVETVGFIVRTMCSDPGGESWGTATKDGTEQDRFAILTGDETYIFLKSGSALQYSSKDGGKTLEPIKLFSLAGMMNTHQIRYNLSPKTKLESYRDIEVWDGDKKLTVTNVTSMGRLADTGIITVEEELSLNKNYTVVVKGFEPCNVVPTEIFDTKEFAEQYHYDGKDLGANINADGNSTTFKVWAPTASKVVLNLFTQGHEVDAYKSVEMKLGQKGVWEHTEVGVGHGTYYTYSVTTSIGTQEATDPYGRAVGLNGNRTMVVDLARTNPEGWDDTDFDPTKGGTVNFDSYSDAFIWEVHVRDFSNMIESSQYKGKYLAFTEKGLVNEHGVPVGIDYLVNLGITHVHILPMYDYATVDEANSDDMFNWGYDPKNYNAPEGSYSTDPYNGDVRIRECKAMIQALHDAGIGVIMDVVYNHTYDKNSSFNRIVPYYYYRYDKSTGANTSASGCGNDTASERYMYNKFMVESVTYWLEEYNLDGFRFDLMGLHDLDTMQDIETAVHERNKNAIIYGEAWTMGATMDGSLQAGQSNISKIKPTNDAIGSVAVFNDAIRDGLKGKNNEPLPKGYVNGEATSYQMNRVIFGIQGGMVGGGTGWTVDNAMVINYMSCHDNYTLWDKFLMANSSSTMEEKLRMNRIAAAILFISKGTVFVQAGEEMLRSKPYTDKNGNIAYDHNSYMSSDEVNNIKWDALKVGSDEYNMMLYYKGLAEMRRAYPVLSDVDAKMTITKSGTAIYIHTVSDEGEAVILINPTNNSGGTYRLNGTWKLVANASQAGAEVIRTATGDINVTPNSFMVFVK